MSGTFMDGGGHDQIGHGVQPGHSPGDACGMDGGLSHNHSMHTGGEGMNFANLLGLNQQNQHSFLAHLLGLDQHTHQGGASQAPAGQHASQQIGWSSPLQGLKLSNFFQGITISASNWLLLMYFGFIAWLCVVYFIRHHEPFANAVLGTAAAQTSTSQFDRQMIAGCNGAMPLRTSSNMTLWAPSPQPVQPPPAGAAAASVLPAPASQPTFSALGGAANSTYNSGPFSAPSFNAQGGYVGAGARSNSGPAMNYYPDYRESGARLRSIVTR
ncbi:MAG TPA: hypothetical protein V6C81_30570 [Planktothrix sp.]|jgi:hypothetical protein